MLNTEVDNIFIAQNVSSRLLIISAIEPSVSSFFAHVRIRTTVRVVSAIQRDADPYQRKAISRFFQSAQFAITCAPPCLHS